MKRRIGILTAGGDCPGLNACIRGVARASYSLFDTEIVGIQDGYAGLIEGNYRDAVGYHYVPIDHSTIRGYGLPDYSGYLTANG